MKNEWIFFLMALFSVVNTAAQKNEKAAIKSITEMDFDLPASPVVDENASAVILSDVGSIGFVGNRNGWWISSVFTRKTRIKIINKTGFDLATVKIILYGKDDTKDKLENIKATTYNLDGGKLNAVSLSPEDVFEDQLSKYSSEKKFTMPNIKEGSVIEYSYKITSYYYYALPSWRFQYMNYPCLYSEFEIATPDVLKYVIAHTGSDSLDVISSDNEYANMMINNISVSSIVHKRKWSVTNVAAFKNEPFIYSPADHLDAVSFHLINTYNNTDASRIPSWTTITNQLLISRQFGEAISVDKSSNLYNTMEKITAQDNNVLDAAKHIYAYVRDNFTCVADDDIYVRTDLFDVNKNHKGSVAEINMLLIALLRQKGLKVDPVILSTRDYGSHPVIYPELNKMNYVIGRLKIYGDTIYLDATRPQLSFGKLPLDCYNGHARIISNTDSADVFLNPESVKELKRTTVFIQNDEKTAGVMTGTLQSLPGYHGSYDIRAATNRKGAEEYFSNVKLAIGGETDISNTGIDFLKSVDQPVSVHYDFAFNLGNTDEPVLYYNPMMWEAIKVNPFPSTERKYAIEMISPVDELYAFNMEIPKGYMVEEMPKSAKVFFNGNEGLYEYSIQKDDMNIQLRSRIQLNRATFRADEYKALRDFFAYIVKKQAEQIVFKRKK